MTAPGSPPQMLTMRQVLAEKQFFRLWIGQLISIFGDFVALFAVQVAITFRMHGTAEDVTDPIAWAGRANETKTLPAPAPAACCMRDAGT